MQVKQSGLYTRGTGILGEHYSEKQPNQVCFLDIILIVWKRSGVWSLLGRKVRQKPIVSAQMKDNECQNEAEAMGSGGDDLSISEVASVKL